MSMTGHQSSHMQNDEWLTPPEIIKALGHFDLDPCSPIDRPWPTAQNHFTIEDDGLKQLWFDRVWCNPPYGSQTGIWLERLANHGNGTALIFARTETKMFFEQVWKRASAVLFLRGRLNFHYVDGSKSADNSGAPSVLVAYGNSDAAILKQSDLEGIFIDLSKTEIIANQLELEL